MTYEPPRGFISTIPTGRLSVTPQGSERSSGFWKLLSEWTMLDKTSRLARGGRGWQPRPQFPSRTKSAVSLLAPA